MNALTKIAANTELTMTSLEIAELVGKEHRNVLRDVRTMLEEIHGEEGVLKFQDTYTNPQNKQSYPIFRLPKRETLILVSGYNLLMRTAIIDRWQELEAKEQKAVAYVEWRLNDIQIQKDAMQVLKEKLFELFGVEAGRIEYIKANGVINKAVCNLYGFAVKVNKPKMTQEMLDDRQEVAKRFIRLLQGGLHPSEITPLIYKQFMPKALPAPEAPVELPEVPVEQTNQAEDYGF